MIVLRPSSSFGSIEISNLMNWSDFFVVVVTFGTDDVEWTIAGGHCCLLGIATEMEPGMVYSLRSFGITS